MGAITKDDLILPLFPENFSLPEVVGDGADLEKNRAGLAPSCLER